MTAVSPIEKHLELSIEAHALLLEENTQLKATRSAPDAVFLEKKQHLLNRLSASLDDLKAFRARKPELTETEREQVRTAQNKVMQALYIDRENEQLLLKYSVQMRSAPTLNQKVNAARLKDTYGA